MSQCEFGSTSGSTRPRCEGKARWRTVIQEVGTYHWCDQHRLPADVLIEPPEPPKPFGSVLQEWAQRLSFMQQAVLLAAVRGPDGVDRSHKSKWLVKFYRRCLLYSAFDSKQAGKPVAILDPKHPGGGSFTGPIPDGWDLNVAVTAYIDSRDELPAHYQGHMMHAVEIMGFKHSDPAIRQFWNDLYCRLAKGLHLNPETEEQLDHRLGDNKEQWKSVQVETYQGRDEPSPPAATRLPSNGRPRS